MAANDEKRDELDKLFGEPAPSSVSRPPGEFTRTFFSPEIGREQKRSDESEPGVDDNAHPGVEPGMSSPNSAPPAAPGAFTRLFGVANADAPIQPISPDLQNRPSPPDSGTLTDLFAPGNHSPIKPLNPQSDTFTRFFSREGSGGQPAQSSPPEFLGISGTVGPVVAPSADRFRPEIDPQSREKPHDEAGQAIFGAGSPPNNLEKATRLFSAPQSTSDRLDPLAGPSAFTRIINSSAMRSAQDNVAPSASNGPTPASALNPPQLPQAAWPVAAVPTPPMQVSAYMPPPPVQMPMPPMAPPVWPQAPSLPAVSPPPPAPQVQVPAGEQTTEQKWATYLPLIIGLNVLFFIAVLVILLFVLLR